MSSSFPLVSVVGDGGFKSLAVLHAERGELFVLLHDLAVTLREPQVLFAHVPRDDVATGECPAIGVLNLDAVPPAAALDEVAKIPAIQSINLVQLPAAGQLPAWLQGVV